MGSGDVASLLKILRLHVCIGFKVKTKGFGEKPKKVWGSKLKRKVVMKV